MVIQFGQLLYRVHAADCIRSNTCWQPTSEPTRLQITCTDRAGRRRYSEPSKQALFAFGRLTGNTDMHTGNLSFTSEGGRPYQLAPAYDMLPMAFQPTSGGGLGHALPPLDLPPSVSDTRFSDDFLPCIQALDAQLKEAGQRIALMG